MTIFVVQAPDADALERASFIKDAFSWPAFVFAQVWLLYHRLWLAFMVWIVAEAFYVVFVFSHVSGGISILVAALAHAFIGLEGPRLREAKRARRTAVTDLVEAKDRDGAESSFYRRVAPAEAAP